MLKKKTNIFIENMHFIILVVSYISNFSHSIGLLEISSWARQSKLLPRGSSLSSRKAEWPPSTPLILLSSLIKALPNSSLVSVVHSSPSRPGSQPTANIWSVKLVLISSDRSNKRQVHCTRSAHPDSATDRLRPDHLQGYCWTFTVQWSFSVGTDLIVLIRALLEKWTNMRGTAMSEATIQRNVF